MKSIKIKNTYSVLILKQMRLLLVFFYGNVQKGLPTQKGNQLNATPKAGMRCASFRHFLL